MKLLLSLLLVSTSTLCMYQLNLSPAKERFQEREELLSPVSLGKQLLKQARSGILKEPCGICIVQDYLTSHIDLMLCDTYGSALMWCCYYGLEKIAVLLLEAGADVHCAGTAGYTPLHAAAQQGHAGLIQLLLNEDACIDAQTANGSTALQLAAQEGHVEAVRTLLACGSDPELVDICLRTPLHLAVMRGQYRTAYELLYSRVAPNARAWNDITPLYVAAQQNEVQLTRLLLDCGGDALAQTSDGLTPLMIAQKYGHKDIVRILRKYSEQGPPRTKRPVTP